MAMFGADDVRSGYKGCYADGNGPYGSEAWGGGRTLPVSLRTNGLTREQCALAAALAGYDVFAMQASGYCFMGNLADVAEMKQKLADSSCSTNPCVDGVGCIGWINTVYTIGALPF
jgi:hypothetical protein